MFELATRMGDGVSARIKGKEKVAKSSTNRVE